MENIKKASIIVAIYKDIEALDLILKSLYNQTYKGEYEVIVAEDGSDKKVKKFIDSLNYKNLIHTTQKDEGWRKNKSLNNAIRHSSGELLIFLDGDCIPYDNLIQNYVAMTEDKTVLCGRRVELGSLFSKKLRKQEISAKILENSYIRKYFKLINDGTRHYEEGIRFNRFFYNLKYKGKTSHIIGCNFAANRKDIYEINGFNEDYHWASVGEDTDLEFRLGKIGCKMKPARNLCNVFHLYHKITYNKESNTKAKNLFEQVKKTNAIICKNGLLNL